MPPFLISSWAWTFFGLTISQIKQALHRLKKSIISIPRTSSSLADITIFPWNGYLSHSWCVSLLPPHLDLAVYLGVSQISCCCCTTMATFYLFHNTRDDVESSDATAILFIHLSLSFTWLSDGVLDSAIPWIKKKPCGLPLTSRQNKVLRLTWNLYNGILALLASKDIDTELPF